MGALAMRAMHLAPAHVDQAFPQSYLSSTRTVLVRDLFGGVRALSDIDGDVPIDGSTLVGLGEVSSGVPKGRD
jgi:hypothetical protein